MGREDPCTTRKKEKEKWMKLSKSSLKKYKIHEYLGEVYHF